MRERRGGGRPIAGGVDVGLSPTRDGGGGSQERLTELAPQEIPKPVEKELRGLGVGSVEVDVGETGATLVRWRGGISGCGAV
jgi:hypothetical protein